MSADRNGPTLAIVGKCDGCKYIKTETRAKIRTLTFCAHPVVEPDRATINAFGNTGPTPSWCPEIAPARRALAHTICHRCGKTVEAGRECYVTPTCFACLPPPAPLPVIPWPPGRERDRLVRLARERLALARETEDDDATEAARAVLASLGVDEAGDDLQPGDAS